MEESEVADQIRGDDPAGMPHESLDLAVPVGDRLNVQRASHKLAGTAIEGLVADREVCKDQPIAAVGVGDRQGVGA